MKPIASNFSRRFLLLTMAALPTLIAALRSTPVLAQADPLPSWNDSATKKSITDFVARVTTQGGPDFVLADQRIATFDNDGTLWIEQPMYVQLAFILDRVKTLAPQNPSWKTKQPFKAVLDGDMKALAASSTSQTGDVHANIDLDRDAAGLNVRHRHGTGSKRAILSYHQGRRAKLRLLDLRAVRSGSDGNVVRQLHAESAVAGTVACTIWCFGYSLTRSIGEPDGECTISDIDRSTPLPVPKT